MHPIFLNQALRAYFSPMFIGSIKTIIGTGIFHKDPV